MKNTLVWTAAVLLLSVSSRQGVAQSSAVLAWGNNSTGQCSVPAPPAGLEYVEIEAGGYVQFLGPTANVAGHGVARLSDGSVVAWGSNFFGQCDVVALPAGLSYVEIDGRGAHTLALRSDGALAAWGRNNHGQCSVFALPAGLDYVEIAAGAAYTVARRSDGSVVAWGDNAFGQCNVPPLAPGLSYVEVAAGGLELDYVFSVPPFPPSLCHTVARRSDGSVVVWGDNGLGQCNVPALPAGLSYVEVAAGGGHTVARRSDGSVVAWGDNAWGQCNVPPLPAGLSYIQVAAGGVHSLARRSDGSVVAWGGNQEGQCNVPVLAGNLRYVDIAAGLTFSMARTCPAGACNPLSLSITQDTGNGCGPIVISVSGASPLSELYNLVSVGCTYGGGPLFGVGLDAWYQIYLPLGTAPFHVLADAMGSYNLSIPGGCTTSVVIEAVTIEVVPGTFVITGVSPTTGWVSLSL